MAFLDLSDYDVNPERLPTQLIVSNIFWVLILLGTFAGVLFYFPIQEKLSGEVEIYYQGVPSKIKAKQNGELYLFVENGETVDEAQLIGLYNWDISLSDIESLTRLSKIHLSSNNETIAGLEQALSFLNAEDIPFLQGEISAILSALEIYGSSTEEKRLDSFIKAQHERIKTLDKNKSINTTINASRKNQNELIRQHILADSLLLAGGIISEREWEQKKREYMEDLLRIDEGILKIENTEESIQGINATIQKEKYELELVNLELYKNLVNALQDYKKVFYQILEEKRIEASMAGQIYYSDILNFSMNVEQDQEILTIKPAKGKSKRLARIITSTLDIGRVKKGNRVMIFLDQYPIDKYGIVYAKIRSRRLMPEKNHYIFGLSLENGLTTSYGDKIEPQPQLKGRGEILLNRTNIFDLIVEQLKARKEVLTAGN